MQDPTRDRFLARLKRFSDAMPESYRARHGAFAVLDHALAIFDHRLGEVDVVQCHGSDSPASSVCIVSDPRPDLLGLVSRALVLTRIGARSAEAYTVATSGDRSIWLGVLSLVGHDRSGQEREPSDRELALLRAMVERGRGSRLQRVKQSPQETEFPQRGGLLSDGWRGLRSLGPA